MPRWMAVGLDQLAWLLGVRFGPGLQPGDVGGDLGDGVVEVVGELGPTVTVDPSGESGLDTATAIQATNALVSGAVPRSCSASARADVEAASSLRSRSCSWGWT